MNPILKRSIGRTTLQVTQLGLGGASMGRLQEGRETDADDTMNAFFELGVNYLDTSPSYGRGKSETMFGRALEDKPRQNFLVSTKVGDDFKEGPDGRVRDFSRATVLASVERSLERMKLDRVEILYLHDAHKPYSYDEAIAEGYPTILELKQAGRIDAVGIGLEDPELSCRFARDGEFDCFLVWGTYSLLDQSALDELLPLCQEKGVSVVYGAPFDSGILAVGPKEGATYHYRPASDEILDRTRRIQAVCERHGVPLGAAAIQFPFTHPQVVSIIPGTKSPDRLRKNYRMMEHPIPTELWADLMEEGLIRRDIPLS